MGCSDSLNRPKLTDEQIKNGSDEKLAGREAMLCAILKQLEINYMHSDGDLVNFYDFIKSAEKNSDLELANGANIESFYRAHFRRDKERLAQKLKEMFSSHERQMISEMVEGGMI